MRRVRAPFVPFLICATLLSAVCWGQASRRATTTAASSPSATPNAATAPVGSAATPTTPPPALAASLTGDARAEYDAANLAFSDGDFQGALLKFGRSYAISKDPRLLWNMAVCEKNLRHYGKVVTLVQRYESEAQGLMTEQDRTDARELRGAAAAFVSRLHLTVEPAGAELAIDEQVQGKAPFLEPVTVDIGKHRLRVSKPGYEEHTQAIELSGGPGLTLAIKLIPEVHEGHVNIVTESGASIFVDGQPKGTGRWTGPLSAGGHTLRIQAPGKRTYQGEVIVQEKAQREVHIALDPEASTWTHNKWIWVAGGALVVAGASVGAYFAFKPKDEITPPVGGSMTPGSVQMPTVVW